MDTNPADALLDEAQYLESAPPESGRDEAPALDRWGERKKTGATKPLRWGLR